MLGGEHVTPSGTRARARRGARRRDRAHRRRSSIPDAPWESERAGALDALSLAGWVAAAGGRCPRARARRGDVRDRRVDGADHRDVAARHGREAGAARTAGRSARRAASPEARPRSRSPPANGSRTASRSTLRCSALEHDRDGVELELRDGRRVAARVVDRRGAARARARAGDLTASVGRPPRSAGGPAHGSRREGPRRVRDALVARVVAAVPARHHRLRVRLGLRGTGRASRRRAHVLRRRRPCDAPPAAPGSRARRGDPPGARAGSRRAAFPSRRSACASTAGTSSPRRRARTSCCAATS